MILMLACEEFYHLLAANGIDFFVGVPDSLLKHFIGLLSDKVPASRHVTVANEGGAVALGAGYHLATGKIPLIYMQNAGEGNAVNPLLSLADPTVYSVPMLFLIGWRGEPGREDEPQHKKQGGVTLSLLATLGIPYEVLPDTLDSVKECLERAFLAMKTTSTPYALVVKKNTFASHSVKDTSDGGYHLLREEAIAFVADQLSDEDVVVATTGKTGRELFEYRESRGQGHERDFLNVGAMGHASQIALGIALEKPERRIYCFDGDGALIMHMGSLAIIGERAPKNFYHIVFNNGAHDSVGGQATAGFAIDMVTIAKACGYKLALRLETREEFNNYLKQFFAAEGPAFLEIRIRKGSRRDLGRPTLATKDAKEIFMKFLN